MRHTFENKNIGVVFCNVRGTLLRKIECSNDKVSLHMLRHP